MTNESERPIVSFCGTVFNSVKTVRQSLESIIKLAENIGVKYEIVIVDGGSTDGTFEVLKELARRYKHIRIFRYKCSRGVGRTVAVKLARGKYIVQIWDLDSLYNPFQGRFLGLLLKEASRKALSKALGDLIPKDVFEVIRGFKDLNRAEDVEFWARMYYQGLAHAIVPIKAPGFSRYELELPGLPALIREMRYAHRNPLNYIRRLTINRLSQIAGAGLTMRKICREALLLRKEGLLRVLLEVLTFIPFLLIFPLTPWKHLKFEAHKELSNYVYVNVMSVCTMIVPEFLSEYSFLVSVRTLREYLKVLHYVSRFDRNLAKQGYLNLYNVVKRLRAYIKKARLKFS